MKLFVLSFIVDKSQISELSDALIDFGALSVSENRSKAEIAIDALFDEMIVNDACILFEKYNPTIAEVPEKDWVNEWVSTFKPIYIDDLFTILPVGYDNQGQRTTYTLEIDPRDAFGAGTHPTTILCLKALSSILSQKKSEDKYSVLDIGTGSGILAIAAAKIGASSITAIDIDPASVSRAIDNAELNDCYDITFLYSSIEHFSKGMLFSLVIANLQSAIIEKYFSDIELLVEDDGEIILSGMDERWIDDIVSLVESKGWEVFNKEILDSWGCLCIRRKKQKVNL
jgi:ribosomal protein L11 methyltransferase